MHRCTRILYTRGGTAGGLSSGELIDNPNTDTPPIGRTARTTSGLPRTERSIFRTLRANDIPVLPGSAMRKNRKHVEIPPAGGRLFVAADFPPIHLLELGHFLCAVLHVPVPPGCRVGGQAFVGDLTQSHETPVAHQRGGLRIFHEFDKLRYHSHPLLAHKIATVGNIAAGAVAHCVGGIVSERFEKYVEGFVSS